jgi:hypothetical protein
MLTFDIECANCHVGKERIDAWRRGCGPINFVCCEAPYLIAQPGT